jgi:hypothetical protein
MGAAVAESPLFQKRRLAVEAAEREQAAEAARAASEALLVRDPVLGEWGYDPASPWVLLFTEADRKGDMYFCAGPPDTR